MVDTKCIILFLASALAIGCVSAMHPMAQSLSPRQSEGGSSAEGSSEEDVVGALPLHELNDNYLSFSDEIDKRGATKNFLRFGKSSSPMASALYAPLHRTEEQKRASRNFLRFGRAPQRNFLRFGKSAPLQFGLGLKGDSSEDIFNSPEGDNFYRVTKAANRNYLRFGRSTESQMKEDCNDCLQESSKPSSEGISTSSSSRKRGESTSPTSSTSDDGSYSKRGRTKRSVSAFYDDDEFMPLAPSSWASQYVGMLPESRSAFVGGPTNDDLANPNQKRSYSRSFLRYGRHPIDLHFIRFGKRGSPSSGEEDQESTTHRPGSLRNFIRFG